MSGIHVAAGGDDQRRWIGRETEAFAQPGKLGCRRGEDPAARPARAPGRSDGPRANENHVGQRAKQTHRESIGRAVAAHVAASGLAGIHRNHSIECFDEVGDYRRPIAPKRYLQLAAVPLREFLAQSPANQDRRRRRRSRGGSGGEAAESGVAAAEPGLRHSYEERLDGAVAPRPLFRRQCFRRGP